MLCGPISPSDTDEYAFLRSGALHRLADDETVCSEPLGGDELYECRGHRFLTVNGVSQDIWSWPR